jgi:hypothetical protein
MSTTKIVIERYPVENLPPELRTGLSNGQRVRVTVETSEGGTPLRPERPLLSYMGAGKGVYTEHEAVSVIRQLRDE